MHQCRKVVLLMMRNADLPLLKKNAAVVFPETPSQCNVECYPTKEMKRSKTPND